VCAIRAYYILILGVFFAAYFARIPAEEVNKGPTTPKSVGPLGPKYRSNRPSAVLRSPITYNRIHTVVTVVTLGPS